MCADAMLRNDFAADQMARDDFLQHGRCAAFIPDAFGINERDGPLRANLQTIDLSAQYAAAAHQPQFAQARFEIVPRHKAGGFVAAFGLGLVGAQENMSPALINAELVHDCGKIGRGGGRGAVVLHKRRSFAQISGLLWRRPRRLSIWQMRPCLKTFHFRADRAWNSYGQSR